MVNSLQGRNLPSGPVQVAYRVGDIVAASERIAALSGAGPFLVRNHPPMPCVDGSGRAGEFRHSSAYGQWGRLQVELVSFEGDLGPARGLHHVAEFVPSLEGAIRRLERAGWPLVLRARTVTGVGFAFCDATADLGHLIELYEPKPALLELYRRVRDAAEGWNGDSPVRPLDPGPEN